jgi:hypothetical protein
MEALHLKQLPHLPQQHTIRAVALALWQHQEVIALWLGGSLAGGTGDVVSDIDLRVAVAPAHLAGWEAPAFERMFVHPPVVGQQFLRFGEDAFLHHLLLSTGELLDLYVQSTEREVTPEPSQILGCRSDQFAHTLAHSQSVTPGVESHPPTSEILSSLLIDFWINTQKHRNALYRGLDLLCIRRIQKERDLLLRLWYIQVSGRDYSPMRETTHALSAIMATVRRAKGLQALQLLGAPTRNHRELTQVIELHRTVVSELGQHLAHQYGFAYPAALEATVLRSWQEFVGASREADEEQGQEAAEDIGPGGERD